MKGVTVTGANGFGGCNIVAAESRLRGVSH